MTLIINGKTYEASELIAYVENLEKENAELQKEIRCECTRCVYSDSPCIRSDYGVENDEDVCPNYENVFVAYTQLKEDNDKLNKKVELLKEELLNPKDKCYSKDKEQLATAKHIIIECIDVMSFHDCEYTDAYKKAKDFILIENGELND